MKSSGLKILISITGGYVIRRDETVRPCIHKPASLARNIKQMEGQPQRLPLHHIHQGLLLDNLNHVSTYYLLFILDYRV